ncbi:fimbrial protein [Enterobacter quasiroggenkampii]|uniref:fimbrial protein n=1 Tax=Enterobacter quasiroggenkampii TaxID=2497436 RepID=UPI0021D0FE60|nr:fimbrial protein [Enterobacter quasiroggenkampii]MCU6278394.1 type 1 fimbrial protein [Enterobacter quasiroggenkampii]
MGKFSNVGQVLPFMLMALLPAQGDARSPVRGHGTVGMKGSIIDTPCAIQTDDIKQVISLSVDTTGELIHDGLGSTKPFWIHLTSCDLEQQAPHSKKWSGFQVTFDGVADGNLFKIEGAEGVGIQIVDQNGQVASPGVPLSGVPLTTEAQVLEYTLRVVAAPHRLRAGDYRSTIRFKVDYF